MTARSVVNVSTKCSKLRAASSARIAWWIRAWAERLVRPVTTSSSRKADIPASSSRSRSTMKCRRSTTPSACVSPAGAMASSNSALWSKKSGCWRR